MQLFGITIQSFSVGGGILILIMPRFLNFVVAIYLIFVGLAGLGLFKMFKM